MPTTLRDRPMGRGGATFIVVRVGILSEGIFMNFSRRVLDLVERIEVFNYNIVDGIYMVRIKGISDRN